MSVRAGIVRRLEPSLLGIPVWHRLRCDAGMICVQMRFINVFVGDVLRLILIRCAVIRRRVANGA